ncbi:MAG: hypothetical protein H6816_00975 [Phycisphaerales bacterium]|nr:hypothetical protein [Phycisphaerales bacterium]
MTRAILLGNHTVAVRALDALRACAEVCAVVAHPEDPEDGVRYASLYGKAAALGIPTYRLAGREPALAELVAEHRPELLLSVDYRYRVPTQIIATPGVMAINFHPGLLPRYRGRAPVNWAILNGERELGLTAHVMEEGIDCGDIVAQERFELGEEEDVGDALQKLYPLYERMVRSVVGHVASGTIPRQPQDHAQATTYPRRRPEDGLIDWHQPAQRASVGAGGRGAVPGRVCVVGRREDPGMEGAGGGQPTRCAAGIGDAVGGT